MIIFPLCINLKVFEHNVCGEQNILGGNMYVCIKAELNQQIHVYTIP